MPEGVGDLDAARLAHQQRDWPRARDAFLAAGDDKPLDADDLLALSNALWWLGEMDESMANTDAAHKQFLSEGRPHEAAGAALDLAINHYLRGDQVLGSAWIARASRLLEDQPESAVHGYLAYVTEVEANWRDASSDEVIAAARNVRRIGIEHGDPSLAAMALNGEGRFRIERGEVIEGIRLLDEAMAAVLAGDVEPDWMGNIYCNTIAACHSLGDFDRQRRWTEATEEWLEILPAAVLFSGICRVHRAELLRLKGDWARAEDEAERVCRELVDISVSHVAEGWYQVGEIRRLRGDAAGAEEAYRRAHEHGRDPQPGLAVLRLGEGRVDAARASVEAALAATSSNLERSRLLAAAVEIALDADCLDEARRHRDELSRIADAYGSSGLRAMAVTSAGLVATAEGETEEALGLLRDAFRRWRELRAPYEAARVSVSLAVVYRSIGDGEAADRELALAAEEFRRLGAEPDHARVVGVSRGERSDGLSRREVEVLALVAQGRTNKEIGEALFISPKTVARHLSNVFAKLGVSSRTEAARYALERNLA